MSTLASNIGDTTTSRILNAWGNTSIGDSDEKKMDTEESVQAGGIGESNAQFGGLSLICQALDEANTSSSADTTPDATDHCNKSILPSHSTYSHFLSTLFEAAETIIGNKRKDGINIDDYKDRSGYISNSGSEIYDKDMDHKRAKKEKKDSAARRKKKADDINSEAIASAIMARDIAHLNGLPHEEIDLAVVGTKRKGKSLRPKRRFDADQKLNIVVGKLKSYYQRTNGDRLGTPLSLPKETTKPDILLKIEESPRDKLSSVFDNAQYFLSSFFNGDIPALQTMLDFKRSAVITSSVSSSSNSLAVNTDVNTATSIEVLTAVPTSSSSSLSRKFTDEFTFTFPNQYLDNVNVKDVLELSNINVKAENVMEVMSDVEDILDKSRHFRACLDALLDEIVGEGTSANVKFQVDIARSEILLVGENRAVASSFRQESVGLKKLGKKEYSIHGLFLCFFTSESVISALQINFDPYTLLRQSYSNFIGNKEEVVAGNEVRSSH